MSPNESLPLIAVIDIGNTRTKVAVFHQNSIQEQWQFLNNKFQENLLQIKNKLPNITRWVCSNVAFNEEKVDWLQQNVPLYLIHRGLSYPFNNLYQTPQTLGLDRMVLTAGAVLMHPNKNVLVIDMGTCITFDFVDSNKNYHGGVISPGMQMRYEMMHQKTANLPLLEPNFIENLFGKTTQECMHIGVCNAICNEIDAYIYKIKEVYDNFTIILTGGDAIFFGKKLKSLIFANSNFLLESLYHLYLYQTTNDKNF